MFVFSFPLFFKRRKYHIIFFLRKIYCSSTHYSHCKASFRGLMMGTSLQMHKPYYHFFLVTSLYFTLYIRLVLDLVLFVGKVTLSMIFEGRRNGKSNHSHPFLFEGKKYWQCHTAPICMDEYNVYFYRPSAYCTRKDSKAMRCSLQNHECTGLFSAWLDVFSTPSIFSTCREVKGETTEREKKKKGYEDAEGARFCWRKIER